MSEYAIDSDFSSVFYEDVISFVLEQNDIEWHPERGENFLIDYSPSFFSATTGHAVINYYSRFRKQISAYILFVLMYVGYFPPTARELAFEHGIILVAMRIFQFQEENQFDCAFIFMAFVAFLCVFCFHCGQQVLVQNAAEEMEYVLNNVLERGYLGNILDLQAYAADNQSINAHDHRLAEDA